jgi:hypothetical protein
VTADGADRDPPLADYRDLVTTSPPRRARHLLDLDAPPRPRDPLAEQRLARVQQWVLSTLAVTTILHLVVGVVVAAVHLDAADTAGRVVLSLIAGAFTAMAVAAGRAIHRRSVLSPWLLLGVLPTLVSLWLTLR